MRKDTIFYRLFKQSPSLLFELVGNAPDNAKQYRFESVAVKEPTFIIDGVFLPPLSSLGIVYFSEFQMQKDEELYERMFGELFLYFYRNRKDYSDWRAVIIYPSRKQEQKSIEPYRMLLESDHVERIYLKELGPIEELPLSVAVMVLTIASETRAPKQARQILSRSAESGVSNEVRRGIIEMVGTIISYKFKNASSAEVDAMLGISFQETRVYQEAEEKGIEKERQNTIVNLMHLRFGTVDEPLKALIPNLMSLSNEDYTRLLFEKSKEELLQYFS